MIQTEIPLTTPSSCDDRLRVGGRVTTRAEDARGIPTQSHISPSVPVYEDLICPRVKVHGMVGCTYESEVNLLWTPHNLASVGVLRAQIPQAELQGYLAYKKQYTKIEHFPG